MMTLWGNWGCQGLRFVTSLFQYRMTSTLRGRMFLFGRVRVSWIVQLIASHSCPPKHIHFLPFGFKMLFSINNASLNPDPAA
jgi:hypothetical protein